jgi:hypothetical protein
MTACSMCKGSKTVFDPCGDVGDDRMTCPRCGGTGDEPPDAVLDRAPTVSVSAGPKTAEALRQIVALRRRFNSSAIVRP